MRSLLLVVHRWAGLTIAFALVVTGLTGAILPWQDQLRSWLAPEVWSAAPPAAGARTLPGLELVRRVEQETGGTVSFMQLLPPANHTQSIFVSPRPGGPSFGYEQVFVDPYTGDIRAKVRFADLRDGAINVMPFLVSFHYSLAAGEWGRLTLGVAALLWCLVCVIGIVLSLPRLNGAGWRGMLKRWGPTWLIRWNRGSHAFTFDLHRASGLWLWPVMLVFAWSAVAFNLDAVHQPVQRFFGGQGLYRPVANPQPAQGNTMSREQAVATGARLMQLEAQRRGFRVYKPEALSLNPYDRVIGYYARTSLDGPSERGSTAIWFDQVSGQPLAFRPPFGSTGADAIDRTVRMLHTAEPFGWPYKMFVSLFGLLTATMAIAGVTLWLRRSARPRRKSSAGVVGA